MNNLEIILQIRKWPRKALQALAKMPSFYLNPTLKEKYLKDFETMEFDEEKGYLVPNESVFFDMELGPIVKIHEDEQIDGKYVTDVYHLLKHNILFQLCGYWSSYNDIDVDAHSVRQAFPVFEVSIAYSNVPFSPILNETSVHQGHYSKILNLQHPYIDVARGID